MATEPLINSQIEEIIDSQPNWKGAMLRELRTLILSSSQDIHENVKWKMPSKPLGSPTWEIEGILCVADYLKKAVRITFPKGAYITDPTEMFNARLDSKTTRAIDFAEGQRVNGDEFSFLVRQAIQLIISETAFAELSTFNSPDKWDHATDSFCIS